MNIIWIAGVRSMNEQPHTSITQNKNDVNEKKETVNNALYISYTQAKLDY